MKYSVVCNDLKPRRSRAPQGARGLKLTNARTGKHTFSVAPRKGRVD